MSYMRDPDRMTRGVGAIASADGSPRRRLQRQQAARANAVRDLAMARVARGALGFVSVDPGSGTTYSEPSGGGARAPVIPIPGPAAASGGYTVIPPTGGGGYTVVPPTDTTTGSPPHPQPTDPLPPPQTSPPIIAGGGSGVPMGPAMPVVPIAPLPPLVDDPMASAPDNTVRNVLIAGGAALALYLLFRRGDGS